jgi:pimeloyl-ACP methyl ester carboxylesterase
MTYGSGSRKWDRATGLAGTRTTSSTTVAARARIGSYRSYNGLNSAWYFRGWPGATDGFTLAAFERDRFLILAWRMPDFARLVTWAFVLESLDSGSTRLIVRARGGAGYRFQGLPRPITKRIAPLVHFIMQRKQLLGIATRAETPRRVNGEQVMSLPSAFRTPEGKTAFLSMYDAALKLWQTPYEELDIPSRFGSTHVIVSGPKDAPPLVLLHGYAATATMWSPYVVEFTKHFRVYAVDIMGQPSKSIPDEPICNPADYVTWLTTTLDALHLDSVWLVGMSFGATVALNYAVAVPERVCGIALLSPGGIILPFAKQFIVRGTVMLLCPTRFTVNWFFRWLAFTDNHGDAVGQQIGEKVIELTYLGLKHFRSPKDTTRVVFPVLSDDTLRAMRMPMLLLIGDHEVIGNPAAAVERARRLVPDIEAELVPRCSHDMAFTQHRIVAAHVLNFLKKSWPASKSAA